MTAPQLLFVTGKGGAGKTTVAASLGIHLSRQGRRVLLVELAADRGIASLLGEPALCARPTPVAPRLHAARIDPQALVEAYFNRILRLRFLTRRLFSSVTFNAVTTAAPGVTEFLLLDHLIRQLDASRLARRKYDLIVVDGPATGHALHLLRTPRQLAAMVPGGPIASTAHKLRALLTDAERTQVLLVTVTDEMAVNETVEARAVLADELELHIARPVLNRVSPRHFTATETRLIAHLTRKHANDPLLAAARLQIGARRDTERHIARLRRAFGVAPISLRQVCRDRLQRADLDRMGGVLGRALFA